MSKYVWEFKQIKDLHLRIVAPRNLFIEFIHEVRSATRSPLRERGKVYQRFKRCLIIWRSPDRAEELIVVFNHNVTNLYILLQIRALCIRVTMIKHTGFYDRVCTCLHNSSVRLNSSLFSNPLEVTN